MFVVPLFSVLALPALLAVQGLVLVPYQQSPYSPSLIIRGMTPANLDRIKPSESNVLPKRKWLILDSITCSCHLQAQLHNVNNRKQSQECHSYSEYFNETHLKWFLP